MNHKRSLAAELMEGLQALEAERLGKIAVRRHVVELKPTPDVTTVELHSLSERLAALARGVDALPPRVPRDTRSDDEVLGYNEYGVW